MDLKLYGKAAYSPAWSAIWPRQIRYLLIPYTMFAKRVGWGMATTDKHKPWNGRLMFWGGGTVWIGHATAETGFHEHHAIQVSLSLEGTALRLRAEGGEWAGYQAAIVAAHAPHAFEASG